MSKKFKPGTSSQGDLPQVSTYHEDQDEGLTDLLQHLVDARTQLDNLASNSSEIGFKAYDVLKRKLDYYKSKMILFRSELQVIKSSLVDVKATLDALSDKLQALVKAHDETLVPNSSSGE